MIEKPVDAGRENCAFRDGKQDFCGVHFILTVVCLHPVLPLLNLHSGSFKLQYIFKAAALLELL